MCGELAEVQTSQGWDLGPPGFTLATDFPGLAGAQRKAFWHLGSQTAPTHLTLSPRDSSLGSSPQLSHWETPVKIFPEGSRQLEGPFGPIPDSGWWQLLGMVGTGSLCDVAAGVGRLCLLCKGVRMEPGSPRHPHVTAATPWELLLQPFLSQMLLRGKGSGRVKRTAHFRLKSQFRHTWRRPFLPQASHRQGPSPCNSPESLNWEPAPSPTRCQETWALSSCPHSPTPPASAASCCCPWKFALFPPDNKPCPVLGLTPLPCSAPASQHQSISQLSVTSASRKMLSIHQGGDLI